MGFPPDVPKKNAAWLTPDFTYDTLSRETWPYWAWTSELSNLKLTVDTIFQQLRWS